MNKGGIGSASIMLVFVVLCLTIFAIISLSPALTDRTLANAEVQLVQDFFAADTLAEQVLAEILASYEVPETIMGIEVQSHWSMELFLLMTSFIVPINETKILHVEVGLDFDSYQIFSWRMYNLHDWVAYEYLNLFDGSDDFFQGW